MPRCFSISIQSEVAWREALRALTEPAIWIAPENSSSFSVSVVLPASGCEMMAKVRRRRTSAAYGEADKGGLRGLSYCAPARPYAGAMAEKVEQEKLSVGGREVVVTNPSKLLFPLAKVTKLDLANYYIAVAAGALRGAGGRPCILKRYPNGVVEEFFFQKRVPSTRPDWIEVAQISFPSGRTAQEIVPR